MNKFITGAYNKRTKGTGHPTGVRGPDTLPATFTETDPPFTLAVPAGGPAPFKPKCPTVKTTTRAQGAYTGTEK